MPFANPVVIEDANRLYSLLSLQLLDSPPKPIFDRFTELVQHLLNVPAALITLVDKNRQFFLSCIGLPEPYATARETPLTHSFCQHTVALNKTFIVEDAREHPLVHDNLAIRDLDVIAYLGIPLVMDDGQVVGTLCVVETEPRHWSEEDIETMQRLATILIEQIENQKRWTQLETQASQSLMQQILTSLPVPIVIFDLHEQVTIYSNHKLERLYGYPDMDKKPVTYEHILSLIHPDDIPNLQQRVLPDNYQLQGVDEFDVAEYRVKHHDGAWRWVQTYSIVCAYDAKQVPTQLLSVVIDVTQQKADQAMAQKLALEAEYVRLLRDFVVNISHDLRTPMASIQLNLDLLKRHPDPQTQEKRFTSLDNQLQILTRILDDLATLHGLYGEETLSLTKQAINPVIEQATALVSDALLAQHPRQLRYELAEGLAPIAIDAQKLELAIASLIENAFLFSEDDDTVTIRTYESDDRVMIEVSDTGVGIAETHQAHIFEALYKVDRARSNSATRSGMGLTLVRHVVNLHRGDISLKSEVDVGTTFTIALPFS